jgi:uncharacterized lipoprotein YehR (DUF1307 family)
VIQLCRYKQETQVYKEELNGIKANITEISQELEVARKQLEEVISGLVWVCTIP